LQIGERAAVAQPIRTGFSSRLVTKSHISRTSSVAIYQTAIGTMANRTHTIRLWSVHSQMRVYSGPQMSDGCCPAQARKQATTALRPDDLDIIDDDMTTHGRR